MRIPQTKQPNGGKRGWLISLDDLNKWAVSYALGIEEITGFPGVSQLANAANAANAAIVAHATPPREATRERAAGEEGRAGGDGGRSAWCG